MLLARLLSKIFKKNDGVILIDSQGQKYICGKPDFKKPLILKLLKKNLNWKLIFNPDWDEDSIMELFQLVSNHISWEAPTLPHIIKRIDGIKQKCLLSEVKKTGLNQFIQNKNVNFIPFEEARSRAPRIDFGNSTHKIKNFSLRKWDFEINEIVKYIDWSPFFWTWELKGIYPNIFRNKKYGSQAKDLFKDAEIMLKTLINENVLSLKGLSRIFKAYSENEDILLIDDKGIELEKFSFLRQQVDKKAKDSNYYCLSDFVSSKKSDNDRSL